MRTLWLILLAIVGIGFFFIKKDFLPPRPTTLSAAIPTIHVANPSVLDIPTLHIHATIEPLGLDQQKRMDVPNIATDAGWYMLGARPGEKGSAVIDGHYDTPTGAPAVFYSLKHLSKGDTITVTDAQKNKHVFIVQSVTDYPYDRLPLQQIFAQSDTTRLNLITCGGTWDKGAKNYTDRTVVFSVAR